MTTRADLEVTTLGPCTVDSPLRARAAFVDEGTRVLCDVEVRGEAADAPRGDALSYEKAGPRERIFFEPARTTAAIVTCGGLSPGLNNVIRSAYHELRHNYGVARVLGIRHGYRGLNPGVGEAPLELDDATVDRIHQQGGTILGSSRGPQEPGVVVDFLEERGIDVLFTVGGDGTQRGAHGIADELRRRGLRKALVGIPKTIDNDILHVFPSFGYATALEIAAQVIRGAHVEATGALHGVSIVKLMGRDAGFIAAGAAVVSGEADFVLVPEVAFPLEGEDGFLAALERRVRDQGHALVVVAEGAGQHLLDAGGAGTDASGNALHADVGPFLRQVAAAHLAERGLAANVRYVDPSYTIRSLPANAWDRVLCDRMARAAAHAAMAGKTDLMIGYRLGSVFHVPIPAVVAGKARMDLGGELWSAVLAHTRQPIW